MIDQLHMGKLIITHKNKKIDYLINLEMCELAQDEAVERILKCYPPDVDVEFIELY